MISSTFEPQDLGLNTQTHLGSQRLKECIKSQLPHREFDATHEVQIVNRVPPQSDQCSFRKIDLAVFVKLISPLYVSIRLRYE